MIPRDRYYPLFKYIIELQLNLTKSRSYVINKENYKYLELCAIWLDYKSQSSLNKRIVLLRQLLFIVNKGIEAASLNKFMAAKSKKITQLISLKNRLVQLETKLLTYKEYNSKSKGD